EPTGYTAVFARQEYVHVRQGLTEEFFTLIRRQVDAYLRDNPLGPTFHIGDKQQALYCFPQDPAYLDEFLHMVGTVCGLEPAQLVIAERHIKAYESGAEPKP